MGLELGTVPIFAATTQSVVPEMGLSPWVKLTKGKMPPLLSAFPPAAASSLPEGRVRAGPPMR